MFQFEYYVPECMFPPWGKTFRGKSRETSEGGGNLKSFIIWWEKPINSYLVICFNKQ